MPLYKPHPEKAICDSCGKRLIIELHAGEKRVICIECDNLAEV